MGGARTEMAVNLQMACKVWHFFEAIGKTRSVGTKRGCDKKHRRSPKSLLHYICRPRNIHVGCMSFITFEIDKVSYLPEIQNHGVKGWEGSDFVQITKLMEAELIVHCY